MLNFFCFSWRITDLKGYGQKLILSSKNRALAGYDCTLSKESASWLYFNSLSVQGCHNCRINQKIKVNTFVKLLRSNLGRSSSSSETICEKLHYVNPDFEDFLCWRRLASSLMGHLHRVVQSNTDMKRDTFFYKIEGIKSSDFFAFHSWLRIIGQNVKKLKQNRLTNLCGVTKNNELFGEKGNIHFPG